ncbi:MAG TPA: DUF58 domain-containing protein [Thermoanaerobaculia bacterium]|nr:DUF58 domain-containing protein [Thermoanaerobaculia bacterium]
MNTFEFDGVVRLTKIGITFLIFTIFIGFAAINTGNNALYIALSFMLGCVLLSGIASKGGLKHLHVNFDNIQEAWAGRAAEGRLHIANRSRIWNVRDVIVTSSQLSSPIFISIINRRSEVAVDAQLLFQRRGLVQLNTLDLYTRYPFGFFFKKRRVRIRGEVVVFPRLLDLAISDDRFRPVEGELHPSNRPGIGSDVHSFRDYVRGDSVRQIYWRKSASMGRWIMKQTEIEAARIVHVVVDPYKSRGASDDDFEQMVSEAATFIYDALHRNLDVMLSLPRATLRTRTTESPAAVFRALALLEPSHEPIAQTIDRHSVVFAVRRDDERASA